MKRKHENSILSLEYMPNVIKIDPYNFEPILFGAFLRHSVAM